jgi:monovalent cation:H+ antiporter, CPA1 family
MGHHETVLYAAIGIFTLLTLATVVHAVSRRTRLPFSVGLLLAGVGVAFVSPMLQSPIFEHLQFSPEIVFYVFLPTLIFESAYHMRFRHFRRVLGEITVLATLGLVCAVGIVAAGLHFLLGLPWGVSLLFGALISATDPVAVLSIFRDLRAPKKLETIVDGESLINDATALVLFQFLLGAVSVMGVISISSSELWEQLGYFFISLFEGLLVGIFFGWVFSIAISRATTKGVQLTLSLVLAHMTFLVAEGVLQVSGILATVMAGLVMGNYGKRKLSLSTKKSFSEIWGFLGFVSNALIFILLGIKIGEVDVAIYWKSILISMLVTIFLARPISVFFSFFLTNLFRGKSQKISFSYQSIVVWGGLRGALAAAAVLLVPADFTHAGLLQSMTAGVILGTFLINALSLPQLLKRFRVIEFSNLEKIQHCEARILISEKISQYLKSLLDRKYITKRSFDILSKRYDERRDQAMKDLETIQIQTPKGRRETEKLLTHYALGIELKTYKGLFAIGEITENRYLALRESIYRQTERLEQDILPEERRLQQIFAPQIPTQPSWLAPSGLGKSFLNKIFTQYRKRKILDRVMHYRARRIASWKVVYEFERLQKDHPIFTKSHIVAKIIKRYRNWNHNAESKMDHLEKEFPQTLMPQRLKIAERECLKKEHQIEQEFFEKGFLNEKVFEQMEGEVVLRERICG